MKYLCLVHLNEKKLNTVPDSECRAFEVRPVREVSV
jgi:hypothetical protein